jgi:N-acetyl-D-muramate 6-phosphate phosphatase
VRLPLPEPDEHCLGILARLELKQVALAIARDRVRAICFDVDGTLRDTDDQFVLRLRRLLRPVQFLLPGRDAKTLARRVVMATENPGNFILTLGDRLGLDAGFSRLGDWIYRSASARPRFPAPLIDGVPEMLQVLQEQFPLSIVSSRGYRVTMDFLDQHQLTPYFRFVATSQTCRHAKPWPDPVIRAAREMQVPAQACLMVGDTTLDIRAGRACGAQTVGVLCGFGQEEELRRVGADLILPTTPDLIKVLS